MAELENMQEEDGKPQALKDSMDEKEEEDDKEDSSGEDDGDDNDAEDEETLLLPSSNSAERDQFSAEVEMKGEEASDSNGSKMHTDARAWEGDNDEHATKKRKTPTMDSLETRPDSKRMHASLVESSIPAAVGKENTLNGKWACEACTYINTKSARKCKICSSGKP